MVGFCVSTKNMSTPSFTESLHLHLQNLVTEPCVNTREFISLVWCWQGSTGRRWGHGVVCLCSQATFNQIKPHPAGLMGAVKLGSSLRGIVFPLLVLNISCCGKHSGLETKFSEAFYVTQEREHLPPPLGDISCVGHLFCLVLKHNEGGTLQSEYCEISLIELGEIIFMLHFWNDNTEA